MEKLCGILSAPHKKWQKSAIKLAQMSNLGTFRNTLYSLNITFGAPPPPKLLKSPPKVQMGSKLAHNDRGDGNKSQEKGSKRELNRPDKEILRSLYWENKLSLPRLGRLFGVHRSTVSRWMKDCSIKRRSFNKLWTKKEIFVLKKFYPRLRKVKMILPLLPGRTLGSIHKKAQELGIMWSPIKKPGREMLEKLYKTLGTKRAANYLGISPTHFRRWAKSLNVKLKSPLKKPDLTASAKLMYVLGVLKGDGCVYKRGKRAYIIELGTKSEEFAESFASALRNIGLAPSLWMRSIKRYQNYQVYVVIATSKKFAEWYKSLNLTQIREMIGENKEFATAFVRGFYESEGSYIIDPRDGTPSIYICNTDWSLLLLVKDLVSSLGYSLNMNNALPTCTGKPFYRLRKSGKTIPELIDMIKPRIKAKPSNVSQVSMGGRTVCH